MTDVLDEPLRSAALYNPHLLSEKEVEDLFVVRLDLLEEILDGLRGDEGSGSRQHRLIVGQRGMGKTMLLRRIQVAIDSDSDLRARFLPLTFPEEQWDVSSARDFWMNCLDSLCDALERRGETELVKELDQQIDELPGGDRAAEKALELLTHLAVQSQVILVLLVDNVDQILERVEEWSLRETLSSNERLVLIGASSVMLESTFNYDKAFYDFLKIHYLGCLSLAETENFLLDYAERFDAPRVEKTIREEAGRIGALHALSGGNPRTTVLFFKILNAGFSDDVKNDLEQLLDQCTPLYKARVEELPPQSQKVLHGLAMAWDPATAGDLAEAIKLQTNSVSSQLNRLLKSGIVEKVKLGPKSRAGFQISERFFNIWFLMRGSRRIRRQVIWLVKFLGIFYQSTELRASATRALREGLDASKREYYLALADSLPGDPVAEVLRGTLLQGTLTSGMLSSQDLEVDQATEARIGYCQLKTENHSRIQRLIEGNAMGPGNGLEILKSPYIDARICEGLLDLAEECGGINDLVPVLRTLEGMWTVLVSEQVRRGWLDASSRNLICGHSDRVGARAAEEVLGVAGLVELAGIWELAYAPSSKKVDEFLDNARDSARRSAHLMLFAAMSILSMERPVDSADIDHAFDAYRPRGDEHEALVFIWRTALDSNDYRSALWALRKLGEADEERQSQGLPPVRPDQAGDQSGAMAFLMESRSEISEAGNWFDLFMVKTFSFVWGTAWARGHSKAAWEVLSFLIDSRFLANEIVLGVLISLLGFVLHEGKGDEAEAWLASADGLRGWEPLRLALKLERRSRGPRDLAKLAPEMREPVQDILDIWAEQKQQRLQEQTLEELFGLE